MANKKDFSGATDAGHLSPLAGRGRLASGALAKRSKAGEGAIPQAQTRGDAPSPGFLRSAPLRSESDLSPQAGRSEGASGTAALYRLLAWLSPAYPVGAFSYSGGLEWAVEARDVHDAATLQRWLAVIIGQGSGFCDAVFLVHAHRAVMTGDETDLQRVAELAAAFASSKERHLETTAQGRAFVDATDAAWPCAALERFLTAWDGPVAYPVAVGVAAAGHAIPVEQSVAAYLQAIAANLVSAGVRLIPLGQTAGQRVLAALEDLVAATAARAVATPLDEIGGAAFRADLAGMRHETQHTRLFRS